MYHVKWIPWATDANQTDLHDLGQVEKTGKYSINVFWTLLVNIYKGTMEVEVARVKQLIIYPIKSAGGVYLEEANSTMEGLQDPKSGAIDR